MSRPVRPQLPLDLPVEVSPEPAPEALTALAGLPLVSETFRALGLDASVRKHVVVKQRERGFTEVQQVDSFLVLNAAGGECVDDLRRLREDSGLAAQLGHELPSPEAGRKFLEAFHSDELVENAKAARTPKQIAFIPAENGALEGLGRVLGDSVKAFAARVPGVRTATVDHDGTIQESRKKGTFMTYKGMRGYQPQLCMWAETGLVLVDEYRDGNVPAAMGPLPLVKRAFAALPSTVEKRFYRADSQSYERELMEWLRNEERKDGPQGPILFAISAKMTKDLHAALLRVSDENWKAYAAPCGEPDELRDVAEVDFVPSDKSEHRMSEPLRYVGIRIRKKQGELFADGSAVKHFAVVSNWWDLDAGRLLQWHREKAGTIELLNDVLKNELAAGVPPSHKFGANAAWLRLACLTNNVLCALKRIALPPEYATAKPKRLRFAFFVLPGRLVHHARKLTLRIATSLERLTALIEARRLLAASG